MNKKATKINKRKIKVRRIWTRSPITQVVQNKKHKQTRKLTKKDLFDLERGIK